MNVMVSFGYRGYSSVELYVKHFTHGFYDCPLAGLGGNLTVTGFGRTHPRDFDMMMFMNLMHSSIGITDSIYAVLSDRDMQQR
jgi:hypothetical protein